jgi:hypothetical protein
MYLVSLSGWTVCILFRHYDLCLLFQLFSIASADRRAGGKIDLHTRVNILCLCRCDRDLSPFYLSYSLSWVLREYLALNRLAPFRLVISDPRHSTGYWLLSFEIVATTLIKP